MDKSSPSTSSLGISSRPDNISTLSIVGMGGLVKTTVAQMVYKDDSIVRNFELRAWVCVFDNFDIYKILRDTAESITRNKYENPSNVDVLANQVKEMLIGKKYLLVLDDLWNEDVGDWEKLKSYLIHGGMGSKILVTTRSHKVASVVGGKIHDLEKLSDDICWSIKEEKILCRGGADVQKDELGSIRTCKMHDLVHDLAMSVQDPNEFGIAKVEDGKEEISQVRRLQLLFDEGPRLASPNVLLNAMKLRTLIAVEPYDFSHINSLFRCRCHCSTVVKPLGGDTTSINHVPSWFLREIGNFKSLRHLDISYSDIKHIPENIGSLEHLRFLDLSYTPISKLPDSITCISSLRTLKFDYCWNLDALPTELGGLTQLRRLNLEGTGIEVLPVSCIKNLWNLEIVELRSYCKLPREINNWPKLRILTHSRDDDVMSKGIERLTCLEILEDYMVRKENVIGESPNNSCGSGVEEMAGLNSLEVLGIRNLENVRGAKEGAERAKLKDKQHLVRLGLYWGSTDDDSRSMKDCKVLEGLQPHSNLRKLYIYGFSGVNLPNWMVGCSLSNCLPNLVTLTLTDCSNCEKLPALGMLPFLQYLKIAKMKSVKCLGEEFIINNNEKKTAVVLLQRDPPQCSLL
ncbi:putative disease resistance protein RGA3 [Papaver somniferum]|uniref:putative disease resistance protein RGA3 n=1 Tax=Papaver somniferum TaxID=3469 RepID=UPI000E705743|nr:putative disease resistance protein RGA3 [Papaver somniferum]